MKDQIASAVSSAVNDNLQNALAKIITSTVSGVEKSVDFLKAEIPDVIHQLLMWKLAESVFIISALIVAMVVTGVLFKCCLNKREWWEKNKRTGWIQDNPWTGASVVVGTIGGILVLFSAIIIPNAALDIIKIKVAPKVYLIEYAADMLKEKGGK